MKSKKVIAIVTAALLMLLPTQVVFAADPADQIVTGDAIVNYVDPASITNVTVPTSAALAFTLDPQNLAATQGVGEWAPEDGGSIIPAAVNIVTNQSAVPMKTTATFTLVDGAGDVVLLDSAAGVNTGTDKNMYLSFVPASAKTTITASGIAVAAAPVFVKDAESADIDYAEADLLAAGVASEDLLASTAAATAGFAQFVETDVDSGLFNQVLVPAHAEVPATTQTTVSGFSTLAVPAAAAKMTNATTGTSLAYVMNKASYYVVKGADNAFSLEYDDAARNDNYDTASFIISGVINKNADWSGYNTTTKITVSATYSFDIMTDAEYTAAIAAKVDGTYNSVETVPPVAPLIEATTAAIDADTAEAVTVSLGAGSSAATGITSVTYQDSGTQTLTVTDDYTFSGTTLTFTSAYINELIAANVTSREYTVTFNNTAATTDTYTLTYTAPVAPSISATTSAIDADTAEAVTVSLGAGSSAATGITSVTYQDSGTQTLALTDDYTFSGTTLTFTSAYVNELIAANVTSREYTITFNNTGATADTYTLTYTAPVTPVAPSITATTSAISADTAVPVTVSLGAGSAAATGIASITYADGGTQTLAAENYTFSGTTLTFTSAYVNSLISGNVTSRAYTITFNDTANTTDTYTLTYTAPATTPSIATTTYTYTGGTPVNVTVNLGTGASAATGITSVYYDNGGTWSIVGTSNWTFSGTTLTFTASCTNTLASLNVASRQYRITFNNSAATTATVTLNRAS